MSALDDNDLAGAKELEEQISALDDEIAALQAEQSAALTAAQEKLPIWRSSWRRLKREAARRRSFEKQIAAQKTEIASLESEYVGRHFG